MGALDQGGSVSSAQWGTHWPSLFEDRRPTRWSAGFDMAHSDDRHLNIQYSGAIGFFGQISHYAGMFSVIYLQLETGRLELAEFISFNQTSSIITQTGLRTGLRRLLNRRRGFIHAEFYYPSKPKFSNNNFEFKTGSVPAVSLGWLNTFQTLGFLKNHLNIQSYALSISYKKNIRVKNNVFLDDKLNIFFSTTFKRLKAIKLSPFTDISVKKLIAPLSPWDVNRQTRWLGSLSLGLELNSSNHKWNFLLLRMKMPILLWASKVGFPDGTEPVAGLSLSLNLENLFRQK
ncbi:MAG: hypothetical protein V3S48_06110 [Candidatus Neomarinimicrobiota bacterium]